MGSLWEAKVQLEVVQLTTPSCRCIYLTMAQFPESDSVRRIILEAEALSAALKYAEGRGDRQDAVLALVKGTYTTHEVEDNISATAHVAMEHILGQARPLPLRPVKRADHEVFRIIARAWIAWVTGADREESQKALHELPIPRGPIPEGGALHLMALQPWAQAVHALLKNDLGESRRMFRRATELSSQCGTETNPAIQWAYAASYFGK